MYSVRRGTLTCQINCSNFNILRAAISRWFTHRVARCSGSGVMRPCRRRRTRIEKCWWRLSTVVSIPRSLYFGRISKTDRDETKLGVMTLTGRDRDRASPHEAPVRLASLRVLKLSESKNSLRRVDLDSFARPPADGHIHFESGQRARQPQASC